MTAFSHFTTAVSIAVSQPAPTTQEILKAIDCCYDVAFVGKVVEMGGFEELNDLLPREDEHIRWGGISTLLVRKDAQLVGDSPQLGWVKIIMSALPLPDTRILLVAKNHPSGIPTGVYLTTLRKGDGSREVAQALADSSAVRCP